MVVGVAPAEIIGVLLTVTVPVLLLLQGPEKPVTVYKVTPAEKGVTTRELLLLINGFQL
jgi:hypothetical protein